MTCPVEGAWKGLQRRGEKEQIKEESVEMKDFHRPDCGVMGDNDDEQAVVVLLNIELTCWFSQFVF